jgi:pantoate--beta-alanine ligase
MKLIEKVSGLKTVLNEYREANKTIGFVPTMGALHEGHLSLVKQAKTMSDVVVVSVFVNPTQFNDTNDLDCYPRTLERDMKLLEGFCDVVFFPETPAEVYGKEIILKEYDFKGVDEVLEGEFRPGHFKGMANVVSKLFDVVNPTYAFFGLKDYQQYLLVKKMVEIDNHNVEIIGCDIVREENGLAMSSRNERLTRKGREGASVIKYTLDYCNKYYSFFDINVIKEKANNMIDGILEVEYLEFRNANTLQLIKKDEEMDSFVICFAGYIDGVRLIDNIVISV